MTASDAVELITFLASSAIHVHIDGNNIFGVPYPADSLTGHGTIAGHTVDCISPEWMVKFHSGYELDMDDYRDVSALCTRFDIELPPEYFRFQEA